MVYYLLIILLYCFNYYNINAIKINKQVSNPAA